MAFSRTFVSVDPSHALPLPAGSLPSPVFPLPPPYHICSSTLLIPSSERLFSTILGSFSGLYTQFHTPTLTVKVHAGILGRTQYCLSEPGLPHLIHCFPAPSIFSQISFLFKAGWNATASMYHIKWCSHHLRNIWADCISCLVWQRAANMDVKGSWKLDPSLAQTSAGGTRTVNKRRKAPEA